MFSYVLSLCIVGSFMYRQCLAQTQIQIQSCQYINCGPNGKCGPVLNSSTLITCTCNTGYTGSRCQSVTATTTTVATTPNISKLA